MFCLSVDISTYFPSINWLIPKAILSVLGIFAIMDGKHFVPLFNIDYYYCVIESFWDLFERKHLKAKLSVTLCICSFSSILNTVYSFSFCVYAYIEMASELCRNNLNAKETAEQINYQQDAIPFMHRSIHSGDNIWTPSTFLSLFLSRSISFLFSHLPLSNHVHTYTLWNRKFYGPDKLSFGVLHLCAFYITT